METSEKKCVMPAKDMTVISLDGVAAKVASVENRPGKTVVFQLCRLDAEPGSSPTRHVSNGWWFKFDPLSLEGQQIIDDNTQIEHLKARIEEIEKRRRARIEALPCIANVKPEA